MKKLIILLLAFISIASCKKKNTNTTNTNTNNTNIPIKYNFPENKHFEGTYYYNTIEEYGSIINISNLKYTIGYNLITLIQKIDTTFKPSSTTYTMTSEECDVGCIDKGIISPDSIVVNLLYTSKSHLKINYPTQNGYKSLIFQRLTF